MKKQHGAAMVEFAIGALLFFMVLFGAIEVGRLMYNMNMLTEVARRGARIAAVCPFFDDYIKYAAVFGDPGHADGLDQNSPLIHDLTPNAITITYYGTEDDATLTCLASLPASNCGGDGTMSSDDALSVRFVEVGVTYQTNFIAPVLWKFFENYQPPTYKTILPRESLGDQQTATNHCHL